MNDTAQKIADAAVPFAWGAWLISHIQQINAVLQTLALVAAIAASIGAAWYHFKKARQIGRHK